MGKVRLKKQHAVGFAGYWRLDLSHESLAKTSMSMTLQIPVCVSHVACFTDHQSRVSHESSRENHFFTDFSSNSHTQPLH